MNRPPNSTLSGNLDSNHSARCNLHDAPIPCSTCKTSSRLSRLKQPEAPGAQLRMFAKTEMPIAAIRGPLEKDLVDSVRGELERLGYKTWSGRIRLFDRPLDGSLGSPFIPILGPGTPDILGVFPPLSAAHGRLFGLEAKRDLSEKERASQIKWRTEAAAMRIACKTFNSYDQAIEWAEELRHLAGDER